MREIIFRGKSIQNHSWIIGNLIRHKDGRVAIVPPLYKGIDIADYEVEPQTIGQYTGLKDKNGTKIFEGDIVKIDSLKYETVFENCAFRFRLPNCKVGVVFGSSLPEIEVIGNIHDNPELLK